MPENNPNTTPGLVYFLHALSPVHMGTGASTGGIDLPLAREVVSMWPYVPGSGMKGVIRNGGKTPDDLWLYGPAWDKPDSRPQGALMFSDVRLLCLPVRSYSGGWAWVTSVQALAAYRREAIACATANVPSELPAAPPAEQRQRVEQMPACYRLRRRAVAHRRQRKQPNTSSD